MTLQSFNRDSPDKEVEKVFRRVLLRAHPDKGGNVEHIQKLNTAKENWDKLRRQSDSKNSSSPPENQAGNAESSSNSLAMPNKGKRIQSVAILLTYNGVKDKRSTNIAKNMKKQCTEAKIVLTSWTT